MKAIETRRHIVCGGGRRICSHSLNIYKANIRMENQNEFSRNNATMICVCGRRKTVMCKKKDSLFPIPLLQSKHQNQKSIEMNSVEATPPPFVCKRNDSLFPIPLD